MSNLPINERETKLDAKVTLSFPQLSTPHSFGKDGMGPKVTSYRHPNLFVVGAPKCGTTSFYAYRFRYALVAATLLRQQFRKQFVPTLQLMGLGEVRLIDAVAMTIQPLASRGISSQRI